ncbi:hypothetical protein SARC_00523 [Sphaeroforma arctica JP610]|uniref:Uncharacterized protein n=1 Tax=Sphaeroforma arctica JP610 TaxID=667725 RepID=A0A0L0GEC9_9EUKA|nr:hypothetical protein SARC_00523 [Sphaeroforma arctica JP610]KNC87382.1 hypothetical protein SARC_00523 [Sphaeroforma arctica JP610]|eukprot:XP_014161284.1 hypothetical protein SARC_00523 [Sphaeroforma arctica JP610]
MDMHRSEVPKSTKDKGKKQPSSSKYSTYTDQNFTEYQKLCSDVLGLMFQKLNDIDHGQNKLAAIGNGLLKYSALQRGEERLLNSLFEGPKTIPRQPGGQQIKCKHGVELKQQPTKRKVESTDEPNAPDRPAVEPNTTDKPAAEPDAPDKPVAELNAPDKPATEPNASDKPAAEPNALDKPAAEPNALDKSAADTSADCSVLMELWIVKNSRRPDTITCTSRRNLQMAKKKC